MVVFQLLSEKLHWNHGNVGKSWDLGFLGWLAPLTYVKDLPDVFHRMPQPFKGHQQKHLYYVYIYILCIYIYIYVYTQLDTIQCYHDSGVWQMVSSCSQTKLVRFIGQKQPRQSDGQSSCGPSPIFLWVSLILSPEIPKFHREENHTNKSNKSGNDSKTNTTYIKLSKLIYAHLNHIFNISWTPSPSI